LNPDRSLTLSEFMELLLRIAMAKFSKTEPHDPAPAAFNRFMDEYVTPMLTARKLAVDPDNYRRERLYKEANDIFLTTHLTLLKTLYNWLKGLSRSRRLPYSAFAKLMDVCRLVSDGGNGGAGMSAREVTLAFIKSRMVVVDVVESKDRFESITFIDFVEALCRVADALSFPSTEDLAAAGASTARSGVVDAEGEAADGDAEPPSPYLLFKKGLAGLVALPRRDSAGMSKNNTRDLPEKLASLLDIVEGMLMEHLQVAGPTDRLLKQMRAETKFEEGNVK